METVQPHPHTQLLRNPGVLATARAALAGRAAGGAPLKILSFGCSLGDELASLKLMFPAARLFGCDVAPAALEIARRSVGSLAEVFHSTPEAIAARGPFDLICALSCLCVHPPPPGHFAEAFPFARFEALTALLADALAPGGVLALYNAAYRFQRAAAFTGFTAVRSDAICRNGFVPLHDETGAVMVDYATSPAGVSVRAVLEAEGLGDFDLVDCVFVKTGAAGETPIVVTLYDPEPLRRGGYELAFSWTRSELDGFPAEARGRYIDMRRRYRAFVSPHGGETLYEFDVARDRLHGGGELHLATYGPRPISLGDSL